MALSAVKTFSAGEVLLASDLNALNTNILNNALTLISPLTGNLNANNNQIQNATVVSSSGSTARTLEAALDEIISPQDFGAAGDGSTNDSTAFTSAEAIGKLVFLPKTTNGYEMTSTVSTTDAAWLPDPTLTWSQWSDDGQLDILRGFFTGSGNGANIWRFADRVFVGHAAGHFAGNQSTTPDGGDAWLSTSAEGPSYLLRNATLLSMPDTREYGIVSAVSTSRTAGASEAIAFGSAVIVDAVGVNAWGEIYEIQHEDDTSNVIGLEIAAKNATGGDVTLTPYNTAPDGRLLGILMAAGGSDAFGPSATDPPAGGIVFSTAVGQPWNIGIVYRATSLTGTDGSSGSSGTGAAIAMGRRHSIQWYEPTGGTIAAQIISSITDSGMDITLDFTDSGIVVLDNSGSAAFSIGANTSTANRIQVVSVATGSDPEVQAVGSDTNVDLILKGQGTGLVRFGSHTGIGAESLTGYITIKDEGGTSRKVGVVS